MLSIGMMLKYILIIIPVKLVDWEQLESLRFPARKIINRTDKSNREKLKYLKDIYEEI